MYQVHLSGGPLDGRTMSFDHRPMRRLEFPVWDEDPDHMKYRRSSFSRAVYEQIDDRTWRYKP